MGLETVTDYIAHRLVTAGGTGHEFTWLACERIYNATGGIPRLINQLCDFCLIYASVDQTTSVLASTVDDVLAGGVYFSGQSIPASGTNVPPDAVPTSHKDRNE
jgi:hypothetical protein